jgi:DNA-binding HxlR family transcriptional regulator
MATPSSDDVPATHGGGATALEDAVRRVGDRWTLRLVDALLPAPQRFGDLLALLDGLAPNILSRRLKALEADGIVTATPYSERPQRVVYALTASGAELAGVLRLLAQWGASRGGGGAAVAHARCGSALEARWWCPTCERAVDDAEAPELDWA